MGRAVRIRVFDRPESTVQAWTQVRGWLGCEMAWIPTPGERHADLLDVLNPATTGAAAENVLLSNETMATWKYATQGEVVMPPECVVAGGNGPNSMRNVVVITTNFGTTLARSDSFKPVLQTEEVPPASPPSQPPLPSPSETPELDSLTLYGGGLTGMAGFVLSRLRGVRGRRP